MPLDAIIGMGTAVNKAINSVSTLVLFAVVPFNLIKGVLVSILTFLLYKRIERLLKMR
jgi:riboflavin transporter FmnP